ncbi:hypothetical protein B484DRAFT_416698 [Ochromonadaceae sp. CCMP2298]|nr:hypothetical protein B484DRAFT_416698 [Ochromonadaceae sp. CCMP2298]
MVAWSTRHALLALLCIMCCNALREFRSYSEREECEMARDANYPFAYTKYPTQSVERKGRVNSNLQDFRHPCNVLGGLSKCHICEEIECLSELGVCNLQLQGVNSASMSVNVPTVSDHAWAVGGEHRHDYGGSAVTHYCVLTSEAYCTLPETTDFSDCTVRCFGYGFPQPAVKVDPTSRSVTDVYPGMGKWDGDGAVDYWAFPKSCSQLQEYQGTSCTYTGESNQVPSFNPQGYTFSVAGSGSAGFKDGASTVAQFNGPEDIAVDKIGVMYVADTQNNAIRMIQQDGTVTTLAGKGKGTPGYKDGPCADATFDRPKGVDVRIETIDGAEVTVVLVADTGNHRIRRIDYSPTLCVVSCLTGLCGNNSLSATEFQTPAYPISGYADGNRLEARFSAPESVAFMDGDYFAVADTGNFLLRWVRVSNGSTETLAGHVVPGPTDPNGKPLAGCTPPCLAGLQGFRDGNLTYAEFYNPLDVTRGPNNTLWVADEQRLRILELPSVISEFYGIRSMGRVSTIAGNSLQGHDDGLAQDSTFFYSRGVFVTQDNVAYVSDSVTCRIRRVTPYPSVAEQATCLSRAPDFIRPSGCSSYDPPVDKVGRKASRVERNVQYNYGAPYQTDPDKGKFIKNCVGVPPQDELDKTFVDITGDNLVIDDYRTEINEDSEQGMAILLNCPGACGDASVVSSVLLQGNKWYSEKSSVCLAALHAGYVGGGLIQITLERRDYLKGALAHHLNGTVAHGITSTAIPSTVSRVFSIEPFNISNSMVHTVAGNPSAPLESSCGYKEGQPPLDARFDSPTGIAARYNTNLSDTTYLYVVDTNNHRIRALSATCSVICENGGRCTGPDKCACTRGWEGADCTKPTCSTPCALNSLCVAPDTCACKPGFSGTNCDVALCLQTCRNGGSCSAPDTCTCAPGWFDTNCTTPVCDNTCANGGNCTAPGTCACPSEWSGSDCRTPLCAQTCLNEGFCVAPNTCICPPSWSGFDCASPVCTQGFFEANADSDSLSDTTYVSPTYKNCNLESWCNATQEFECDQRDISYGIIKVPSGPAFRKTTGRKTPPNQCMNVELPINFKVPYQLLRSDDSTTGDVRYSEISPYTSNPANIWKGYFVPTKGHTGPWTYSPDRQVANVNWLNITQGRYVCANGGSCTAPDTCACAAGWIGFDCRTPVCTQGYYKADQEDYVSGLQSDNEVDRFEVFMGYNSYRLQWPYSNPNYSIEFEFYEGPSVVTRELRDFVGKRYNGAINFTAAGVLAPVPQGGYRCTIRADTSLENANFVFSHPNYYSRYMDKRVQPDNVIYTDWEGMEWPPLHSKSSVIDQLAFNLSFSYTNEGYRRQGVWNRTGNSWEFGVCIVEFFRNCSQDSSKQLDVESDLLGVYVQDTDLAFRPRITYNDQRVLYKSRWAQAGGACVDNVIRGCANNGTCIAPDTCRCAQGWEGSACRNPICSQTCFHNGNCTLPDTCTCEAGWSGYDCLIPICAQECQNKGVCVAPDVCKCAQWDNTFRDGRVAGGRPLFQDETGDPLPSGWTGFDCATPICVQAETFLINVATSTSPGYVKLGGHGGDDLLTCTDDAGIPLPRCPQFDEYVTGNDGRSFQTGCGWDPLDTGCCIDSSDTFSNCYYCRPDNVRITNSTWFCTGGIETVSNLLKSDPDTFVDVIKGFDFLDKNKNIRYCGEYHNPRLRAIEDVSYGTPVYYYNVLEPEKSVRNYKSNYTSDRFLCHVRDWLQGDYVDDAGMSAETAVGSVYGLSSGRHVRINTPNIITDQATQTFTRGPKIRGEGLYSCYNGGSCIGPDTCTCTDGYEGDDCNTPLCRHLQVTGSVSSCLNGGICSTKDSCDCVQADSVLWLVHDQTSRGQTGWTGSDCSMPICVQGFYDPFCGDLPQAPGGEGCFRCSNGGNCTAPDTCACAEGWAGFDCKTPVCEIVADPLTRVQLGTVFEDKVIAFETDPCGVGSIYGKRGWKGRKYARGNCTQPNQCTCLCKVPYFRKACHKTGMLCDGPWQDNMVQTRDLPGARGPEFTFGTTNCYYGYEGNVDEFDRFTTCHQTIYRPSSTEEQSLAFIVAFSVVGFFVLIVYRFASVRIKRRFLLAKIERRRTRRDSEASMQSGDGNRSSVQRSSMQ